MRIPWTPISQSRGWLHVSKSVRRVTATSSVGSSARVMDEKRVSWRADVRAYSLREVTMGSEEKVPMQPRRVGEF